MDELYIKLMSDKDYYDIAKFVEELYLMDCNLIILMARKFFTLFMAFHNLNRKKYQELGIKYESKKRIITNVALPLYEKEIREGEYKKIVIADDIIIHGRGVSGIYGKLHKLNPNCDIQIRSYLRNDEEKIFYEKIIDLFNARYLAESDYWKMISTKIVDSFYIIGRPYISYLPYLTIRGSWEELLGKLEEKDCYKIGNEVMRYHSVEGLLYCGKSIDLFKQQEYCKICGVRLYNYKNLGRIIAIPYFCMDVINNGALYELSNSLRNTVLSQAYRNRTAENNGADRMRLIELEYILSYWMAMLMVDRLKLSVEEWNYDVEECSFMQGMTSHDIYNEFEIRKKLKELNSGIKQKITRPESLTDNKDIALLVNRYEILSEKYNEMAGRWKELNSWNDEKYPLEKRFLEELLFVNGKLDEKRLDSREKSVQESGTATDDLKATMEEMRKGNGTEYEKWLSGGDNRRLLGIPLPYVVQDMGEIFQNIDGGSLESHKCKVFANILSITDSGKGSVMARIVDTEQSSDKWYHESLLHAGEQNYVFFDNTNFPSMYALYLIEQYGDQNNVEVMKKTFINRFGDYLNRRSIIYDEKELQQLAETDISPKYGKYLRYVYYRHKDNDVLKDAINMARLLTSAKNRNDKYC